MSTTFYYVLIFAVLFIILLIALCKPFSRIKHHLIDLYTSKQFGKIYRKKWFFKGWGPEKFLSEYKKLLEDSFPIIPPKIDVKVFSEEHREDGSVLQILKFLSPFSNMQEEGVKDAVFCFVAPEKKIMNQRLLVINVAGGQKGYKFRLRIIGEHFLKRGYSVLMNIPLGGIHRVPKRHLNSDEYKLYLKNKNYKKYSPLRFEMTCPYVYTLSQITQSMIIETRAMINHLVKQYGFKEIVCTGQSWGACQSAHVANLPVSEDKTVKVGVVPYTGMRHFFSRKFMKGRIISENLKIKETPEFVKEVIGKQRFEELSKKKDAKKLISLEFGSKTMFPKVDLNKVVSNAVYFYNVHASNDCFISKLDQKEIDEFSKEILKKNGKNPEKCFASERKIAGHFTSFRNKKTQKEYREVIEKVFKIIHKLEPNSSSDKSE